MYKLTYLVPMNDAKYGKQFSLAVVTHPQEIVIRELADGIKLMGWKVRMWNKAGELMN